MPIRLSISILCVCAFFACKARQLANTAPAISSAAGSASTITDNTAKAIHAAYVTFRTALKEFKQSSSYAKPATDAAKNFNASIDLVGAIGPQDYDDLIASGACLDLEKRYEELYGDNTSQGLGLLDTQTNTSCSVPTHTVSSTNTNTDSETATDTNTASSTATNTDTSTISFTDTDTACATNAVTVNKDSARNLIITSLVGAAVAAGLGVAIYHYRVRKGVSTPIAEMSSGKLAVFVTFNLAAVGLPLATAVIATLLYTRNIDADTLNQYKQIIFYAAIAGAGFKFLQFLWFTKRFYDTATGNILEWGNGRLRTKVEEILRPEIEDRAKRQAKLIRADILVGDNASGAFLNDIQRGRIKGTILSDTELTTFENRAHARLGQVWIDMKEVDNDTEIRLKAKPAEAVIDGVTAQQEQIFLDQQTQAPASDPNGNAPRLDEQKIPEKHDFIQKTRTALDEKVFRKKVRKFIISTITGASVAAAVVEGFLNSGSMDLSDSEVPSAKMQGAVDNLFETCKAYSPASR